MKKDIYTRPEAEKIVFDYEENVVASNQMSHADSGIGFGQGGGCDHEPHHGNPHKPHP